MCVFLSQSSGVGVHDDVINQFNDFKLKREPHNYRYFIYKIENDTEITIESTGDQSETYDDFAKKLLQIPDCRYGLIDLDVTTKDGRPTSKLVFVSWYANNTLPWCPQGRMIELMCVMPCVDQVA